MIIRYKKFITSGMDGVTITLQGFGNIEHGEKGPWTYCYTNALPTGQDSRIQSTIEQVTVTDSVRDQIRNVSSHCALIRARRKQALRDAGYTDEEQEEYLRLSIQIALAAAARVPGLPPAIATALGNVSTSGINISRINQLAQYVNAVNAASDAADAAYAALGV
jgi:hypothetical protein